MTRTVIESKTKTAIIGFDQPFCVIGERINPTGRKILNEELEAGDFSRSPAGLTTLDSGAALDVTRCDDTLGGVFERGASIGCVTAGAGGGDKLCLCAGAAPGKS